MNRITGVYGWLIVAVVSLLVLVCNDHRPTGTDSANNDPVLNGCGNNPSIQPEQDKSDTCVVLNKHEKCRKHHKHHHKNKKRDSKGDDTIVTPDPEPTPEPTPTPVPPSCGMACFTTDANTIAHWTFDNMTGNMVPDQGPNHFDATAFGGPTLAAATCGSAINLSSGQYLDAPGWNRLVGYSKVTFDVLFKINSMRDDGTAGGDMLSELVNDSHWYPIGGAVVRVRNSVCQFAIASTNGWQYITDVVPVSFGEWHHVSASFDQTTSTMTLQLDCNSPVSMTYSGTFVPSYVSYIRIASCVVDPPSRFVNGAIDAIIIKGWK